MSSVVEKARILVDERVRRELKGIPELKGGVVQFVASDGDIVEIPKSVQELVLNTLSLVADEVEVSIQGIGEVLSSTVAAEILGVSRTTVLKWANQGKLPSHKVGSHIRFMREDVMRRKDEHLKERLAAFEELRRFDLEHDHLFDD